MKKRKFALSILLSFTLILGICQGIISGAIAQEVSVKAEEQVGKVSGQSEEQCQYTLYVDGELYQQGEKNYEPYSEHTLRVEAQSPSGKEYRFEYEWVINGVSQGEETKQQDSIKIKMDSRSKTVFCYVKEYDEKGNPGRNEKCRFFLETEDLLDAYEKFVCFNGKKYDMFCGTKLPGFQENDKILLEINVPNDPFNDITYEWHRGTPQNPDDQILSTSSTFEVVKSGEPEDLYFCKIAEGLYSRQTIFALYSELMTESYINNQKTEKLSCVKGNTVTLSVKAEESPYSDITYQWGKDGNPIPGETKKSISVKKADGSEIYYCTVADEKREKTVYFNLAEKSCPHIYVSKIVKATTRRNGSITRYCAKCGITQSVTTIPAVKTVKLSGAAYTYNGKAKTPKVSVIGSNGKVVSSTDYSVYYSSGRKKVGKYTVKVILKGNYSGTVSKTFVINPKKTSLSKIKAKKKSMNVTWKKLSKSYVTGYQIQYTTDKKFKKRVKTSKVTKYKTSSKTIKKLKAKKKYYVRVRTYKKVGGKIYYSDWSKVKYVKVK